MKKLLLILILLPMLGVSQQTYVPDDNFEQELINLGYDNFLDDSVLTVSIDTVTSLYITYMGILDLTGIEDFLDLQILHCYTNQLTSLDVSNNTALTALHCLNNNLTSLDVSNNLALTELYCSYNNLISLDVSNNTALTYLNCYSNNLTSLDVSNNTALITLYCHYNQLTSLDVSNNTALTYLNCYSNNLTSLDVSGATALDYLYCRVNQLTSLDVSGATALYFLSCSHNQLTSLDVSTNTALTDLGCGDNLLTSLDVSTNTALTDLGCGDNLLTSLDVSNNTALYALSCSQNQLTSIDVSNNTALTALYCYDNNLTSLDLRNGNNINFSNLESYSNPNLTCISVDDADWSDAYWTMIDPASSFGITCSPEVGYTHVPDNNFEQALITLGYDNFLDDYVLTANINTVTSLNVSGGNISDLTGIEDFTALTTLYCYNNQLTSLDVSNATALDYLNCGINQLTSLDVSNNTALTTLYCYNNQLTSLDVSNNTALDYLYCPNNQLTSLDVSNNTALDYLNCGGNQLTSLDVSNNTALTQLSCYNNQLTSLDVSQNPALTDLYCPNNQLTFINLSGLALSNQMMWFYALDNPLVCVLVQNTAYFNINFINDIPPSASFNQPVSNISTVVSCSSYQWAANGQTYNSSGTHTEEILSVNGCLNTEVLNLTITQPTTSSVSVTECDGYTWNGINYTSSGIYTWTGTNTAGCDSTATLNLSIIQSNTGSSLITTCDSYTWDGSTYSTTGVYANSYNNMAGCDSVHTLFLVITDSTSNTISETICDDPYYWFLNGQTYDSSGVYTETSTNSNGCTHTETLDLTINYSTSSTDTHFACDEFMWYCDGNLYTSSNNTATYVYTNAVGCDSIVTLDLTINSVIASIDQEGDNLSAVTTPVGLNANWYNIQTDNGETRIWLMEEDTSSFSPTFECSYFIIVNDAGCVDTSETYYYGANAARIGSFITSPNPTTGLINVKFDNPKNQFVMLELISNNGSKLDEFITVDNNLNIDLSKYPSGSYYLYFNSEDAVQGCRLEEVQKISAKIILNK